ncbi:MAG: hypothetical protein SPL89_06440 [Clostridia bacterium]|nr:hypothetical protein [Clostridia bacterium]
MTYDFKEAYAACIGSLALLKNKFPGYINAYGEKLNVTYKGGTCLCGAFCAYAEISDSGIALLSDAPVSAFLSEHGKYIAKLFSVAAGIVRDFDGIDIHLQRNES